MSKLAITIINRQRKFAIDQERIKNLLEEITTHIDHNFGELEVVFLSPANIRKTNQEYRGINRSTDVLSFDFTGPYDDGGGLLLVSPLHCLKQGIPAEKISEEVAMLLVHGLLHLAGMDHPEADVSQTEMGRVQSEILTRLPSDLQNSIVMVSTPWKVN